MSDLYFEQLQHMYIAGNGHYIMPQFPKEIVDREDYDLPVSHKYTSLWADMAKTCVTVTGFTLGGLAGMMSVAYAGNEGYISEIAQTQLGITALGAMMLGFVATMEPSKKCLDKYVHNYRLQTMKNDIEHADAVLRMYVEE